MNVKRIKLILIAIMLAPMLVITASYNKTAGALMSPQEDVAAVYKSKCAACHTAKAEKFFDPAKAEEAQAETILKGKKGEKPPYMPGYEAKGMTKEQATALAQYMKQLRTPAN